MTGMLASVTSIEEAEMVLNAGVDIIDIKNPLKGALGALDIKGVKNIVQKVNGAIPTSATVGDINPDDPNLLDAIFTMASTGVDFVKVGLFDNKPSSCFIKTIINATNHDISLVIVSFAENYSGKDSITPFLGSGIVGIMLDTKEKTGNSLRSILDYYELQQFVELAREFNLLTGLAGSLRFDDIEPLLALKPDYLGFRGALCKQQQRIEAIDEMSVHRVRSKIPNQTIYVTQAKAGIQ